MTRATHRKAHRVPVSWNMRGETSSEAGFVGNVLDVSIAGAFMETPIVPHPTERVLLRWSTPEGDEIECPAWVRWAGMSEKHRCRGVGLQFARDLPELEPWYVQQCLDYWESVNRPS